MITSTMRTVSTVEELRALPHRAVILHPTVHYAAQVMEYHSHGTRTRRLWHIAEMEPIASRAPHSGLMPAEEWLVQWLGTGQAFMVLYEGAPWPGYVDCNDRCRAAERDA